jgi:hypothetical protein
MSRSNPRTGNRRHRPAGGRTMGRLLCSDAGKLRGRRPAQREHSLEPEDEMAEILHDIDAILKRHSRRDLLNTEIRRRIEMLREEQRLQQELTDIYDA